MYLKSAIFCQVTAQKVVMLAFMVKNVQRHVLETVMVQFVTRRMVNAQMVALQVILETSVIKVNVFKESYVLIVVYPSIGHVSNTWPVFNHLVNSFSLIAL